MSFPDSAIPVAISLSAFPKNALIFFFNFWNFLLEILSSFHTTSNLVHMSTMLFFKKHARLSFAEVHKSPPCAKFDTNECSSFVHGMVKTKKILQSLFLFLNCSFFCFNCPPVKLFYTSCIRYPLSLWKFWKGNSDFGKTLNDHWHLTWDSSFDVHCHASTLFVFFQSFQ